MNFVSSISTAVDQILIDHQLLKADEVKVIKNMADQAGCALEEFLVKQELYSREQLFKILENHFFCPSVDLRDITLDPGLLTMLPRRHAERYQVLPVGLEEGTLRLAFANPDDERTRDAIASMVQHKIAPVVTLANELGAAISSSYDRVEKATGAADQGKKKSSKDSKSRASDTPAARVTLKAGLEKQPTPEIVEQVISTAIKHGISDIHFQPEETALVIRYRLDGLMHNVVRLPTELTNSVVSRVKVLGEMDIAKHGEPQDGRASHTFQDTVVDLRISVLPSQFGEKAVIRLLTKDLDLLDVDKLQMPPAIREGVDDIINNPQGFYLVTGPTGSGKSTTLYAVLSAVDCEHLNVITLEDPIEYSLPRITQVQMNEKKGMTFASGLRSVLRQDPDVVLVGEIRDVETVEVSCRAALTGHKVLSTVHTNDSFQAITRLIDMGTPPFLIAATLRGVLSQRLLRCICEHCKEPYEPNETELALLGYPKADTIMRGAGCAECANTGYKGRMAIFEYFKIDENMHRLIIDRASPYAIKRAAKRDGMILMEEYAKRAVLNGKTTVSEIQRVVLSDQAQEQQCSNCQRVVSVDFSVCPFCQHQLWEKCSSCGNVVDPSWEACPSCGHEIEREWQKVFCGKCQAPVEPDWKHCHYCGNEI